MAEYILQTDSLNDGRTKLNLSIEQAERAEGKADDAISTADTAKASAEQTRTELDAAILAGDSSPLAGQLSVGANAVTYPSAQERFLQEYNGVSSQLAEKVTQLHADKIVTVGATGDFTNINDALSDISKTNPNYIKAGYKVEIRLLTGFVMQEQVFVKGIDFSWVEISSDDLEVTVDRSSIIETDPGNDFVSKPIFLAYDGATLPVINTVFNVDLTGEMTNVKLFLVRHGSKIIVKPDKGGKGGAERLLSVTHGSIGVIRLAKFTDGAYIGVRVSNGSILHASNAVITGNYDANVAIATAVVVLDSANCSGSITSDGIRLTPGPAIVSADSADVSNCGGNGLRVLRNGQVSFYGGFANNCIKNGVLVEGGGSVNAEYATITGCGENSISTICGEVNANNAVLDNAGINGILAINSAKVTAQNASGLNCGANGVLATSGSTVNAQAADFSEYTSHGILCQTGANINAHACAAQKLGVNSNTDYRVLTGGIINASNSIGGFSKIPNEITSDGIIFQ